MDQSKDRLSDILSETVYRTIKLDWSGLIVHNLCLDHELVSQYTS